MYLLGLDIGSSSVKASLTDGESGRCVASAFYPPTEMAIFSPHKDWAEQNPEDWVENLVAAVGLIREDNGRLFPGIGAIGISYQMHGLVMVDRQGKVLRNSIIWCDSRAVDTGIKAQKSLGQDYCLGHLLNSPGNFTASKLGWVKENEPELYSQVHKIMLPGDFVAYRLTGEICTTETGLSEGIFWDFESGRISEPLMDYFGFDPALLPEVKDVFSVHGRLLPGMAEKLGLRPGIPISYRAGDQPNNAFSLNVLQPGEVAATAGTSAVIYGVTDQKKPDPLSRVNTFLHVNHNRDENRLGVLLCLNSAGILNSWIKNQLFNGNLSYEEMNLLAGSVNPGSDGLRILPFGNGAERLLQNRNPGVTVSGLNLNLHTRGHLARAAQEGIVFALVYGLEVMRESGLTTRLIRACRANMFLSRLFAQSLADLSGATIQLYNTDGSQGAARGAGIGTGYYPNFAEAFSSLELLNEIQPEHNLPLAEAFEDWKKQLSFMIDNQ